MYAAQNGYIFIGESLLLVLSKLTFIRCTNISIM